MSGPKRQPHVGRAGRRLHEKWSKATIHEALLDTWMESHGKDCSPDDLSEQDWADYAADVERRSLALRGPSYES